MRITFDPIEPDKLRDELVDRRAGAYVGFEGWIRDHNEGQEVLRLEYEVYEPVAIKEGEKVIEEARSRFPILHAECPSRWITRDRRIRSLGRSDFRSSR